MACVHGNGDPGIFETNGKGEIDPRLVRLGEKSAYLSRGIVPNVQSKISTEGDRVPKEKNGDSGLGEKKTVQKDDSTTLLKPDVRVTDEAAYCNASTCGAERELPMENANSASAEVARISKPCQVRHRAIEPPFSERHSFFQMTSLEMQMLEYADCLFRRSPGLRSKIQNAQVAAGILQAALGSRSKVHVVLETSLHGQPTDNGQLSSEKIVVMPLFSATLIHALKEDTEGCSIAACALSEALCTASRICSSSRPSNRKETPVVLKSVPEVPVLYLPSWYPNLSSEEKIDGASTGVGENIVCDHDVMSKLSKIPVHNFVSIYGLFFSELHGLAVRKKRASGPITYSLMTPLWLRNPVVFLHGKGNNLFLRYDKCKLPSRNTGYKKEGRILCRAIICTWLAREPETRQYLIHLFKSENVYIYDDDAVKTASTAAKRECPVKVEPAEPTKKTKLSYQVPAKNLTCEEDHLVIDGIRVGRHDLATLDLNTCINDRIINGFFSLLKSPEVAVMDTYFPKFLREFGCGKVMKWTTKHVLEECMLCLLPLHSQEQFHWGLAALFKSSGEIRFYDSKECLDSFAEQKPCILDWAKNAKQLYNLSSWPAKWIIDETTLICASQQYRLRRICLR